MTQFELVIFDCDGVLVDSEHITTHVFATALNEIGLNVTAAELYGHFYGRSTAQCLEHVTHMLGKPLPETFVPSLRQRAAAALWAEVTPVPGVAEALARIQIPICVASSGDLEKVHLTLGKTGLLSRFGPNIFTAADVSKPKPAPDIFLLAAHQNGVEPHTCAVVEDSPVGVRAGVAAGMVVFGFAARTPAHLLKEAGAHVIVSDIAQLPHLLASSETKPQSSFFLF
jgi:HAD superfamily hydrolase (TIGR01509 family)